MEERTDILIDSRFARLFQDPDFAIDETSREFQMINPSTKPGVRDPDYERPARRLTAIKEEEATAGRMDSDSNETSSYNEHDEQPAVKAKDAGRILSSSYRKAGHRSKQPQPQIRVSSSRIPDRGKDLSVGDRAECVRVSRPAGSGAVVGERGITFAPERKIKAGVKNRERPGLQRKEGRRSASGNVFRNM